MFLRREPCSFLKVGVRKAPDLRQMLQTVKKPTWITAEESFLTARGFSFRGAFCSFAFLQIFFTCSQSAPNMAFRFVDL